MGSCFQESFCKIIHKREKINLGYLRTEGGTIRMMQMIIVLINFSLLQYYKVDNMFSSLAYDVLIVTNTLMIAYIFGSCLSITFFLLVEIGFYKNLHYNLCHIFTGISILQQCINIYSFEKCLSNAYGVLIAMSTCLISLNIYDWYFGASIEEKPLNETDSFLYFDGDRSLNCFNDCIYRNTFEELSEEDNTSSDSLDIENCADASSANVNDSGIVESDIVEAGSGNENRENQRAAIKADKNETSEEVCATDTGLISIVKEGENTASMVSVKVPESTISSIAKETNESGAIQSKTVEPDQTVSSNVNANKPIDKAIVALKGDEPEANSTVSEQNIKLATITASDESLAAASTKDNLSSAHININAAG